MLCFCQDASLAAAAPPVHHRECQTPVLSTRRVAACRASRKAAVVLAYRSGMKQASDVEVQCIKPSSNLAVNEQAIITFGQAYMMHSLHRQAKTRLGHEQQLFAGLSRCMLDACADDPVLYISGQGPAHAAAVLYTNEQEAQLIDRFNTLDFSVIPGTLQMLQGIPENGVPAVVSTAQQRHNTGVAAMQVAGHKEYLKLMLLAARPAVQGSGLGRAVLQAVCDASDRMRLPLYLEAADDELLPIFEREAFRVLGKAGSFTMMLREDASRVHG